MKLSSDQLIRELSTVVDPAFADAAVKSYVEMQQRFLAGDWKPAELDGGRLCEAVSRALLQMDTGRVTHKDLPGAVRQVLLDQNRHHNLRAQDRQHIVKVIDMIYKFRSDRGPVHISPIYTANFMDSMLVLHAGKWLIAEFLRLAWNKDRDIIAAVIEQLVQLEHSLVHELDGEPLVLSRDISAPDEVLVLLYHAANNRLSRADLRLYAAQQKSSTVSAAVSRLINQKFIRPNGKEEVVLTPSGQKKVLEEVLPKWTKR